MDIDQLITSFKDYRESWLEDIIAEDTFTGKPPSTVVLGNRFAHKIVTQWKEVSDESFDLRYCDGAGDGGIDIAYLHRGTGSPSDDNKEDIVVEGDTWYLVQSKYGAAFQGVKTLLEEGQKLIDTLDGQRKNLSSLAEDLVSMLRSFIEQAKTHDLDRVVLVYATENPLTESQKRVLEDVQAMGRNRLGNIFDVQAVSLETLYRQLHEGKQSSEATESVTHIQAVLSASVVRSGDNLLIGAISLYNLYEFLKAYEKQTKNIDRLFSNNVRLFLGSKGKINKRMKETLEVNPNQFGLFNNGVTLVVEDFVPNPDGSVELIEPYVVNGCQTTRTIWDISQQKLGSGGTGINIAREEWTQKAKQGVVIVKIVKVGAAGTLLEDIIRFTNSQNAVSEKDFLTLKSDFRTMGVQMREKYKVYLEVQRGEWDSYRAYAKQHPSDPHYAEMANAFDLIKVYGAGWLGEAGLAFGNNAAFLPNGSVYKRIFNTETEERFSVDDFYAAYKLQMAANDIGFGRKAKDERKQTRFLFYMVVIELLKDMLRQAKIDTKPKNITRALLTLFEPGNENGCKALLDAAIGLVDRYMTPDDERSMFTEPTFKGNLNDFLKSEKLGKEDDTPDLRFRIAITKEMLSMKQGLQSPRDMIIIALKEIK